MLSYYEFNWGLEEDHDKGRRSKLIAAATGLGVGAAAGVGYKYLKGRGKRAADVVKDAHKGWSTGKKGIIGAATTVGTGAVVGYGVKRLMEAKRLRGETGVSHIKTGEKEGRDLVVAGVIKRRHLNPDNLSSEFGSSSSYWIGTPEEWEQTHRAMTDKFGTGPLDKSDPHDVLMVKYHIKNYKGNVRKNGLAIQQILKQHPHDMMDRTTHPLAWETDTLAYGFQKG